MQMQTTPHREDLRTLKDNAWKGLVEAQGDVFVPLCHEMGGIMGDAALDLLSKAAARYSPITAQQNAFKCFG